MAEGKLSKYLAILSSGAYFLVKVGNTPWFLSISALGNPFSSLGKQRNFSTVVLPCLWFHFPWFQLPTFNLCLKYYTENSRNTQFIHFKFYAVLSSAMKSCAIPLLSTWDVNHSFFQSILAMRAPSHSSLGSLSRLTSQRHCAHVPATLIVA